MGSGSEVLPFLAWSPTNNVLERRPADRFALARAFRQIDVCRDLRRRLVVGGPNALFVLAAYLANQLSPVVPAREVVRLLDTKLPEALEAHVIDDLVAYVDQLVLKNEP